ncbi:carboxypeptidase regulatory-like domain-containing protein [uncultured Aquimarina sp.]|uniref:carboxypeptidase regulatory-like domain-containing protein n=1 Tax=uncultured Aquimarina sp. TaxID=575652 RepID=UPI00262CCDF7|nr:carboxypeptidase regulatory-like domain-containing protein [uncultured Aquimarina sp.]
MHKKVFILIFFFYSLFSFGQYQIKGKVTDSLSMVLSYANIQVLDSATTKIYAFTTTKSDGTFSIDLKTGGNYRIKASFLGYEPQVKVVDIRENVSFMNFRLIPKTDALKEVVINYNPKLASVRKDTITYNLNKIVNGQEENLKEVLEKLPGIDINERGKVTAFGKKVGKLLIDGEDIFKEQHQFATENITADMIAGVTFFQKYKGFANIDGFDNEQTTAVNISIKDEYKQRVTGNIEVNGGVLNKYLLHTNLFKLGKKLKLTLLGDFNNVGKESISFDDYIDLNTTVKSTDFGNSTYYDDNDIPTFLSSTRDVANREIGFGALNFVYSPKKTLKISGYSIFNTTTQAQSFFNTRKFFEEEPDQTENRNILGDFVFNTTQIKAAYKYDKHTFIQYTITNNPEMDNEQFDLSNNFNNTTNTFDQQIRNVNKNLGQELKLTTRLSNKSLLEFTGYTQYKESNRNVFINSNNPFLGYNFINNQFRVEQSTKSIIRTYGYALVNKNKSKIGNYDFISGLIHRNQGFSSVLNVGTSNLINDLSLRHTDTYVGGKFSSKNIGFFSYRLGLEYHHFFYNLNNNETNFRSAFFPTISINLKLKHSLSLSFNYSYQNEYPSLTSSISNDVVYSYLNKQTGGFIDFNEVLPTQRFGSTISWTDFKKGNSFLFSLQLTDKPKSLTRNINYQPDNFTENEYRFTDTNSNIFTTLSFDKTFNKAKLKFSSITLSIINTSGSFINEEENIAKSYLVEQNFKFSTNYKRAVNFNAGISFTYLTVNNSFNDTEFFSNSIDPYFGMRASLFDKKMTFDLDLISKNFKAGDVSRSFIVVNPSIKYAKPKSHWEFSITGNNIFNLESPEIVDNVNNNVFFEERVSRTLEGYLIFGANYKF